MRVFIRQEFEAFKERWSPTGPLNVGPALDFQPGQVPVWLAFRPRSPLQDPCTVSPAPPDAAYFGAILDTGNVHTLSLKSGVLERSETELRQFVEGNPLKFSTATGKTGPVPRLHGDLWIYSNVLKDPITAQPQTVWVNLGIDGIGCYFQGGPRVPILGMRSLINARMNIHLHLSNIPLNKPEVIFYTAPKKPRHPRRKKS